MDSRASLGFYLYTLYIYIYVNKFKELAMIKHKISLKFEKEKNEKNEKK